MFVSVSTDPLFDEDIVIIDFTFYKKETKKQKEIYLKASILVYALQA